MLGSATDVVSAFAAGKLDVDARAAPLAEVGKWWSAPLESGERLVFIP